MANAGQLIMIDGALVYGNEIPSSYFRRLVVYNDTITSYEDKVSWELGSGPYNGGYLGEHLLALRYNYWSPLEPPEDRVEYTRHYVACSVLNFKAVTTTRGTLQNVMLRVPFGVTESPAGCGYVGAFVEKYISGYPLSSIADYSGGQEIDVADRDENGLVHFDIPMLLGSSPGYNNYRLLIYGGIHPGPGGYVQWNPAPQSWTTILCQKHL